MASTELRVGVEVELEPGPKTVEWLESLGWIRPEAPSSEAVQTEPEDEDDYDPMPADMVIPEARPTRGFAHSGSEVMRCQARKLRTRLRGELEDPDVLDELLRLCDVNVSRLLNADECGC